MKEKIRNQSGFIQIPILIAIIAGILVLGGGGYFGVRQYKSYQAKQIEKEGVAQEKDKQNVTQPVPEQPTPVIPTVPVVPSDSVGGEVSTPATPITYSTGGGGGARASSGPHLVVPLKCSDYTKYFASIPDCEFIKQNSSANKDGVEIEHPLYTLCKQCLPAEGNE
ncbi:MAG: hypothetical protein HYU04_01100 [Candidatus Wildermuthbacteria bacterium]|nr:hypothetical protein [Candidatus Wildermuthbacteria bacterium]